MSYKRISEGVFERHGTLYVEFRFNRVRVIERFRAASIPNIKAAERKRAAILNEIDEGRFDYRSYKLHFPEGKRAELFGMKESKNDLVGERLETWLEGHKSFISDATIKSYAHQIKNHLLPEIGNVPFKALTMRHAKKLAIDLAAKSLSKKSIKEAFIPLRMMYGDAVSNGEIDLNPIRGLKLGNLNTNEKPKESDDVDPFSKDEIFAILTNLDGQMRNFYTLAFCSALRVSEIIALRWDDIDWIGNKIAVSRAKVLRKIKTTKTKGSTRIIDILPLALAALKNQRAYTQLKPHGYIFENPNTGKPFVSDKSPREAFWTHALKRGGVRYRYPYQCKHTFISQAIIHQKPLTWIAKQAGHTTIQMIVKHYARFIEETRSNEKPYWENLATFWLRSFEEASNHAP